ncbi:hypothetical protein WN944_022489 [Citrus x changshan-huyou]|uniref:Uncharacterized protein n=1 Tax=Citrus x changshan-huyou TaxID=2935761 RepID=A0AAP0N1A7_9ROSI
MEGNCNSRATNIPFFNYEVVLKFCSSKDFERSKSLDVSALADQKHLNSLQIVECYELEELKMDYTGDFTFLAFAPNLKCTKVNGCRDIQEIVSDAPERIYRKPLPFPHLKEMKKGGNSFNGNIRPLKMLFLSMGFDIGSDPDS